ncbi:MAG: 4-alpha-glucanotransferase [Candidatus Calescibacterium sp.]|nr:4-alpha-glucanotransferase [Candidatus Calescibacterium sp.]MDW8132939.1 4-alpha-glucanotransferase [Candidatus Calescibacterium sp.]
MSRKSGILYPISSFYRCQKYDIFLGDWGNYGVVDYIKSMGFKVLQILPINPICRISFSPYSGNSAFGFEYAFVSVDMLVRDGIVEDKVVDDILSRFPLPQDGSKVYYEMAFNFKQEVLEYAFKKNFAIIKDKLDEFLNSNNWVKFFSLYNAIKEIQNNKPWYEWENDLKYVDNIDTLLKSFANERYYFYVFTQFVCYNQYIRFKNYANSRGVLILGDVPIYVSHDSVDVWANRGIFKLDSNGYPEFVAGVPPDYFSETGQLWGNPVYDWDQLEKHEFKWWIDRLSFCFNIYDWVRIDHFRGLVSYWQVKYGENTAVNGCWVDAKPYKFFNTLLDYKSVLPVIAEDLGVITPDVDLFRQHYGIPSMRVLQFGFSDPDNIHLPHNYSNNIIAYTGTHDNNTTKGWYRTEKPNFELINNYFQKNVDENNVADEFVKLILSSPANLAVIPIQDILGLDENYRINIPGTTENNWVYRDNFLPLRITEMKKKYIELNYLYKRT